MIERRRRFFRGDSLLHMPIFPRFLQFLSICMRIPKRNWHYIFSQVAIATSTDAEKLVEYVEGSSLVIGQR